MALEHVRDYVTLSDCYDLFNERLFGGQLRGCVLTFEDRGQHFGYYRQGGFIGREAGERRDEICLNPRHFLANSGDLELLQTLVHEQAHQWQYQFGSPSRRTYHNREWAEKMLSVGLVPSHTGRLGGNMTGQHMADYPAEGGAFLTIAREILAEHTLIRWYKEGVAIKRAQEYTANPESEVGGPVPGFAVALAAALPEPGESPDRPSKPPGKATYQCQECGNKVWGKPGLLLICGDRHAIDGQILHLTVVSSYPSGVPA